MDGCVNLTINDSLPVITNMAQKQNEHNGWMYKPGNQALTYCNHKHGTQGELAQWTDFDISQ